MFKFLHAADIHLDSPLRGLSRYESAPAESVRNACRRAFENLVDLAIEEKVAFVLLSGDLYDGDWKDYSTGIFLGRQVGRLGRNGIAVFAVAGNHDAASRITEIDAALPRLPDYRPPGSGLAELDDSATMHAVGAARRRLRGAYRTYPSRSRRCCGQPRCR